MCKEVSDILNEIKTSLSLRSSSYFIIDLESNVISVKCNNLVVSTIFIKDEIHNECIIPLDPKISFSNSMSYSLKDFELCIEDLIKALNEIERKCFSLSEIECDTLEEISDNKYSCKLSDNVNVVYGLGSNGFYCDVMFRGPSLSLDSKSLNFIKVIVKTLEVNANLKFDKEELKASEAFISEDYEELR